GYSTTQVKAAPSRSTSRNSSQSRSMQTSSDASTIQNRPSEETQQTASRSGEEVNAASAPQQASQKRKRDPNEEEPEVTARAPQAKRTSPSTGTQKVQTSGSF